MTNQKQLPGSTNTSIVKTTETGLTKTKDVSHALQVFNEAFGQEEKTKEKAIVHVPAAKKTDQTQASTQQQPQRARPQETRQVATPAQQPQAQAQPTAQQKQDEPAKKSKSSRLTPRQMFLATALSMELLGGLFVYAAPKRTDFTDAVKGLLMFGAIPTFIVGAIEVFSEDKKPPAKPGNGPQPR